MLRLSLITLVMGVYVLLSTDAFVLAQSRDSVGYNNKIDSLLSDTARGEKSDSLDLQQKDTTKKKNSTITDILSGTGKDSLVYDLKTNKVYMYEKGSVIYQDKELGADYINLDISNNVIIAKGVPKLKDTIDYNNPSDSMNYAKPKFVDGESTYDMDSIVYNLKSEKAKIYGISFKEGEGTLRGKDIKKVDDEIFNINQGIYTTCDAEHPHFYLKMSKAQYVQSENAKKIIIGPSFLVLEDVPLPLGVPFGFFPMMTDRNSGVILPEIGEDSQKGFYLKDFGYYFAFNDYIDITARGGIYTYGSWEADLASTYRVKYKYNGNFGFDFANDKIGDKGSSDFKDMKNYRLVWTHTQDSKFMPGSTFSASVNYATSSYNKYDTDNIDDYVSAQTNSSISYSKTWAGTPFSFSTNIQHSQNNRDSSVMLSLPNYVFNVSRFYPFQRKNAVGKQRWYEKIALSYTNTLNNSISTNQTEMFKREMFDNMKIGMKHTIPVSTNFNLLKYVNFTPSVNYNERWYFKKINQAWNPEEQRVEKTDTVSGFYRVYDYNFSASMSTKMYGMFTFKGKNPIIKAVRHVLTPSVGFTLSPDFGSSKYGYYEPIQSNAAGDISYYSPFASEIYGVPGRGKSASMSFSLGNTLEMKVRSDADTTGVKLVKILESLSLSSSYNFLADSMNLSNISLSARTTLFKTLGINVNATFDPYAVNEDGIRINQFLVKSGKLARLTNLGFSFGYSFRSAFGASGEGSGTGSETLTRQPTAAEQEYFNRSNLSYAQQQEFLTSQTYYNFSVPWNLSFNYNFSYSNSGKTKNLTQTMSFNGSINLTNKFGLTFNSGLDLSTMQITPGSIGLTRDLHCWQMSFTWVPVGFRKSWNFRIAVNSSMLKDLKYEKNSGYLDNYSSYY